MPEVTLELLSQGKSEKFTKPEIRLGREPSCEVVFPSEKFPMVGRQHAVLRSSGGAWSVEDLQSTNGTFVNQVRIQRQQLVPGDTVRLGSDGPEIRIQFVDESYSATIRPAGLAAGPGVTVTSRVVPSPSDRPPTRPAEFAAPAGPQIAPTKPSEPPPTRPAVAPTAIAATRPSPLRYSAPAPAIDTPDAQMEHPDLIPGILPPEKQDEISEEEEEDPMNEQKLSLLRNLVILMVGLVLVLGGIVISQMQQLADIRQNVVDMRAEGRSAVGKFMPELDQRMNKIESNMDGMDDRMQKAQDKFMSRLDVELPKIMDKYVEKKKKEIVKEAAEGNLPQ